MTETTTPKNESTPAASRSLLGDLRAELKQLALPGIDVAGIIDSRRKDIDAIVAANDTALKGVQNLAQVQGELLKGALGGLQRLADRSGGEPAERTGVREAVTQVMHRTLAGLRELAEAGYRAQAETLAVVSRRLQQDLEEATARLQPRS